MPGSPAHEPRFSAVITFSMPWFNFGQSCPAPVFSSHNSYGSHKRCVSPPTSGQVQYRRAGRVGPVPAPVPDPVPAPVPEAVQPQGFRRYQTRMGPRAPSPVPQQRSRRARPSKRARTSGPGKSSSSRPQPSPATSAVEATSSAQLSPASRIRRPLFVGTLFRGMSRFIRETSLGSHIMVSPH